MQERQPDGGSPPQRQPDGGSPPRRTTAEPPLWRRDEPDSPCRNICAIHPAHGICIGCHRTAAEITGWAQMTGDERRAILRELAGRGRLLRQRRGGRSRRLNET